MNVRPGDRIDRYTLVRPLGKGGQGSVWQVIDPLDEGAVRALKLVSIEDAGQAAFVRARSEAKILAHLTHPSLCACHGLFEELDQGLVGVVLDLVQGRPLDDLIRDPRFDDRKRAAVLMHLAQVLAFVHQAGLVHRDLKPSNILITDGFWEKPELPGTVKLVDFGIAVAIDNPHRLTSVGGVIGTVPYLSPELFDIDARGASEKTCARDLFAFGVIAWEVLFGGHPTGVGHQASFDGMRRRYREIAKGNYPWPPKRIPGKWGTAIAACLAFRPEDRPRDGQALLDIIRTGQLPPASIITKLPSTEPDRIPTDPSAPFHAPDIPHSITEPMPGTHPIAKSTTPVKPMSRHRSSSTNQSTVRSIHTPVYVLAFAILVLAVAIYFRPPGIIGNTPTNPKDPSAISAATSTTSLATSTISPPTTSPVTVHETPSPAPIIECCGGPECHDPQKNVKNTYCETDRTRCATCTSRRTYVADACAKKIDNDRVFQLRLAHLGMSLAGATVCFRKADAQKISAACLPIEEASDINPNKKGKADSTRLTVTTKDLTQGNLLITVKKDGKVAAEGKTYSLPGGALLVSTLCVGLKMTFGNTKKEIKFYLDDQ